jgi:hypothetical protein
MKHKCPLCGEESGRGLAAEKLLTDLVEAGEGMKGELGEAGMVAVQLVEAMQNAGMLSEDFVAPRLVACDGEKAWDAALKALQDG